MGPTKRFNGFSRGPPSGARHDMVMSQNVGDRPPKPPVAAPLEKLGRNFEFGVPLFENET